MQVIRELKKVNGRQITIDLPESFYAHEVEVIVIPYKQTSPVTDTDEWKQDFLAVSQWEIAEEDSKIRSWPVEEF